MMPQPSALNIFRDEKTSFLIKRLLKDFARPYLTFVAFGLGCMILASLMSVACAKLIEPIINDIFVARRSDMLLPVTFSIVGVFLVKGLSSYGESISLSYVGYRMVADLQKEMFAHLITCDLSFFHSISTGELVSRFTNDIQKLNHAVTGTLLSMFKDSFMLGAFILFMFYQDWFLSLMAFLVLPVAILPLVKIGKRMRSVSNTIQEDTASLTSLLTQAFQGIRLIKSYGMEKGQAGEADKVIHNIFGRSLKAARVRSASHPLMEFLGGIAIGLVVLYGGSRVIAGQQNPGTFFSFITAFLMSYEPLKRLAHLNANLQDQLAALTRILSFLDLKPTIQTLPHAQHLDVRQGTICFENVSFSYDKNPVLKHIDCQIPAGKTVALVGRSGSGKSTFLNLIPRFYETVQGRITIDGMDIRHVTLSSLRENIALVSQETVLFDESIRTNIAFGAPGASDEAIRDASRLAAAHDFIMDLPQGYDTLVGEQGVRLSGGQRQRIAIARALLKNAPILLLDEPTSALDSASEYQVQQALKSLIHHRTTLIIAHRLATVRDADMIFVVEGGQIIASGQHETLLKTNTHYARLCRTQLNMTQVKEVVS